MKNNYTEELEAFNLKCAEDEKFYTECGNILNIPHTYTKPAMHRTRWNNRLLGNGRYVGFGTIQCFGPTIRVMSKLKGTVMLNSNEEVYQFLRDLKRV